jgi:hypothetical protein
MLNSMTNVTNTNTTQIAAPITIAAFATIFLSFGNDKISRGVGIFDLPAWFTCPAKGFCQKYCSAFKAQVGKWKGVAPARWQNFHASLRDDFVDNMVARIQTSGVCWIRFQVSGDLYNQAYVQKLAEIARRLPNVNFYLYTKSLDLDLAPLTSLPNFTVIRSFGGSHDRLIETSRDNYARVIQEPNEQRKGEFLCPEGLGTLGGRVGEKLCGGNCSYCLSDKKTEKTEPHQIKVVFLLRKGGWNGNKLPPPPPTLPSLPQRPSTRSHVGGQ